MSFTGNAISVNTIQSASDMFICSPNIQVIPLMIKTFAFMSLGKEICLVTSLNKQYGIVVVSESTVAQLVPSLARVHKLIFNFRILLHVVC